MEKELIVVTGGTGYVGSHVARALGERGHSVRVVDVISPEERGISFSSNVIFHKADLRVKEEAREALSGADTVFHFGARIGSIGYMQKFQGDILTDNARIDANTFSAMKENNVKLVLYSSSSMVFQEAKKFPYWEGDLLETPPPRNVYGFSKLAGEYFARSYYAQYKIPYVILRFYNIYGPGEEAKGKSPADIHVIPALIEKTIKGMYPLPIIGDPHATRSFLFIDDVVEAILKIFDMARKGDENVLNNDFNIGSGDSVEIVKLGEIIWNLLGDGRSYKYISDNTFRDTAGRREVNPKKIREIIGWEPRTPLSDGILKVAKWMKEQ
jgi:nucleoside-diphosphate-sugar epimerase